MQACSAGRGQSGFSRHLFGRGTATLAFEAIVRHIGAGDRSPRDHPPRAPALDAKKHKTPAHVNVALGVEVDLSKTHNDGVVAFRATRDRCQKILQLWDDARQADRLTAADAASLLGKLTFLLTPVWGRVGRAATLALVQRQHHDGHITEFTDALRHAHDFFKVLLSTDSHGRPRLPGGAGDLNPEGMTNLEGVNSANQSARLH